jgi:hypothetical protein
MTYAGVIHAKEKANVINKTYFDCSCGNKFNDLNCQSSKLYTFNSLNPKFFFEKV